MKCLEIEADCKKKRARPCDWRCYVKVDLKSYKRFVKVEKLTHNVENLTNPTLNQRIQAASFMMATKCGHRIEDIHVALSLSLALSLTADIALCLMSGSNSVLRSSHTDHHRQSLVARVTHFDAEISGQDVLHVGFDD